MTNVTTDPLGQNVTATFHDVITPMQVVTATAFMTGIIQV